MIATPRVAGAGDARTERLSALGRLWYAIDLFHPALAEPALDWDSVFAACVPAAADARTDAAYLEVVDGMLAALGDPSTRVVRAPGAIHIEVTRQPDGIVVVGLRSAPRPPSDSDVEAAAASLRAARGVLVDIEAPDVPDTLVQRLLAGRWQTGDTLWIARQKVRRYSGFPPEGAVGSPSYTQTWRVIGGAPDRATPAGLPPLVFRIRRGAALPSCAAALQAARRCEVIAESALEHMAGARRWRMPLPGGATAVVRTGEILAPGFRADSTVAPPAAALDVALARLRARLQAPSTVTLPASAAAPRLEALESSPPPRARRYGRGAYPSAGYRVLAAVRIWRTIDGFFAYKHLMGEDWDTAFRRALPAVEAARDSIEYALALSELCTHIHDSHVRVNGGGAAAYFGTAMPLVRARIVEDVPLVTRVLDDSLLASGAIAVGDEILAVDGEPAKERIARLGRYLPASTPQALRVVVVRHLLAGPTGSSARLRVRGADGRERDVRVPRRGADPRLRLGQRSGDVIQVMPGNIGYVDLDRLTAARVGQVFDRLMDTRAIVFDMRGYPRGSPAWSIVPRLAGEAEPLAALFRRPELDSPDPATATDFSFEQRVPPARGRPFTGPTFLLVDERTISAAEHTGLFFEAANGTQFVGSPSMGANGDITTLRLPGDLTISFTGHDVRHADGRQLQRVGLVPHVAVLPTVAGIRAGRDEVLERALRLAGGTGERAPDVDPPAEPILYPTFLAALPDGWSAGRVASDFDVGKDSTVAHGGQASGAVRSVFRPAEGSGTLEQSVRADAFRGQRLRVSAQARTRDASGEAGLFARVLGPEGQLEEDARGGSALAGTQDWTPLVLEIDVPEASLVVTFGFTLSGAGEAWIDDVLIVPVGASKTAGAATAPTKPNTWVLGQRARAAPVPRALGFE